MRVYLDLLDRILSQGKPREDRTGKGTLSVFGHQLRVNLGEGFPALTTKKLHLKSIFHELLWFISGSTQLAPLKAKGVSIWDAWATEEQCARFGRAAGDLGPIYGHQWRNFGATRLEDGRYANDGVDQLARLIQGIKENPSGRRHLVTGWNPSEANEVTLPPCHTLFQFYVQDRALSCHLYQRSADCFLGVPFNIASYAALTMMIAQACDLVPGDFVHSFGDAHLYRNHLDQARLQLGRSPRALPRLHLNPEVKDLFKFEFEDLQLEGYDPHPHIKAEVAV